MIWRGQNNEKTESRKSKTVEKWTQIKLRYSKDFHLSIYFYLLNCISTFHWIINVWSSSAVLHCSQHLHLSCFNFSCVHYKVFVLSFLFLSLALALLRRNVCPFRQNKRTYIRFLVCIHCYYSCSQPCQFSLNYSSILKWRSKHKGVSTERSTAHHGLSQHGTLQEVNVFQFLLWLLCLLLLSTCSFGSEALGGDEEQWEGEPTGLFQQIK